MPTPRAHLLDHAHLQSSLQELSASATNLNTLSDQLSKQVAEVESAVNKMGIGLSASVNTESWSDELGEEYDTWRLCYAKHQSKWGFTIEHLSGHVAHEDSHRSETWAFREAPREHRLKAVTKIPELVDALVQKSKDYAADVSATMSYAQALAAAFSAPKK